MNGEQPKRSGKVFVDEMKEMLQALEDVLGEEPSDENFLRYDNLLGDMLLLDAIAEEYDFDGEAEVEEEFKNVCARIAALIESNKDHFG